MFERILDVAAAESDGNGVGDRVVSCRLLVNAGQAGGVIGKGGIVVAKIRADTGCRIRVLNDKLPACTKPSDEIIEVVIYLLLFCLIITQIYVLFLYCMLLINTFDQCYCLHL